MGFGKTLASMAGKAMRNNKFAAATIAGGAVAGGVQGYFNKNSSVLGGAAWGAMMGGNLSGSFRGPGINRAANRGAFIGGLAGELMGGHGFKGMFAGMAMGGAGRIGMAGYRGYKSGGMQGAAMSMYSRVSRDVSQMARFGNKLTKAVNPI